MAGGLTGYSTEELIAELERRGSLEVRSTIRSSIHRIARELELREQYLESRWARVVRRWAGKHGGPAR